MAAGYELYLIRHGIAEDRGEAWPDDTKRPLTERGIARLKKEARGLARLDVSFDVSAQSNSARRKSTHRNEEHPLRPRSRRPTRLQPLLRAHPRTSTTIPAETTMRTGPAERHMLPP